MDGQHRQTIATTTTTATATTITITIAIIVIVIVQAFVQASISTQPLPPPQQQHRRQPGRQQPSSSYLTLSTSASIKNPPSVLLLPPNHPCPSTTASLGLTPHSRHVLRSAINCFPPPDQPQTTHQAARNHHDQPTSIIYSLTSRSPQQQALQGDILDRFLEEFSSYLELELGLELEQQEQEQGLGPDGRSSAPSQVILESSSSIPSGDRLKRFGIRTLSQDPSTILIELPIRLIQPFTDRIPIQFEFVGHPSKFSIDLENYHHQDEEDLSRRLIDRRISYDSRIDAVLDSIDHNRILDDVKTLSVGHDPHNRWITRHSFSEGGLKSVFWLKDRYEAINRINCRLDHYLDGINPNLICQLSIPPAAHTTNPSNFTRIKKESVLLISHYDSKSSFGSIPAPGVDDNASGCAVLLSIAETVTSLLNGEGEIIGNQAGNTILDGTLNNRSSSELQIYFINLSGHHQGLLGSRSMAKYFFDLGLTSSIIFFFNLDMISYRVQGEPIQLGLSTLNSSSLTSLNFVKSISNIYVPDLLVGNCSVGVSDELNFKSIGGIFESVRMFERIGDEIKNPHHLKISDDFSNFFLNNQKDEVQFHPDYDIFQTASIAQVLLACVLQLILN